MIDRRENLAVDIRGFGRIKRKFQHKKHICQTLDTQTDGTMTHIGILAFDQWVKRDVDHAVQISRENFCRSMKSRVIKCPRRYKSR